MNCYYCERTPGPGGLRYHVATAVGICHHCGAAVCAEHSAKSPDAGALLLCSECAAPGNEVRQPPASAAVMETAA